MKKNLIWITLDSVRWDHTTMGGYSRNTTPNLQKIAREGVTFDECIAHSHYSLPSIGSILTGRPPGQTTVGMEGDILPDDVTTVPELLGQNGYTTAAISRNTYLSPATGLDRGFEKFRWLSSSNVHRVGFRTLLKYLLNIRRHSAGLSLDTAKYGTPYLLNDVAKRWLKSFSEPFFLYMHYMEPHRPYYPPLPYMDRFTDEIAMSTEEAAELAIHMHNNLNEIIANGCDIDEEEWEALVAMYDAEIAYTDEMVGRLHQYVEELGFGDTVFVVTADHGELFGEQGMMAHKTVLNDAVLRVPLVLDGLDVENDGLVQHSDVMKTFLEESAIDSESVVGYDLRHEKRDYAVSQRGPQDFDDILKHNPEFDVARYHAKELSALRSKEYKLLSSEDRTELYRLPDEENDVAEEEPEMFEKMKSELDRWTKRYGTPVAEASEAEFTGAMEEQLRNLGYID